MLIKLQKCTKLCIIILFSVYMSCINANLSKAAENQVRTTQNLDYQQLKQLWKSVNYGYEYYDGNDKSMKKQYDYIEQDAKRLLAEMETSPSRSYLWKGAKDIQNNSSHMTKSYQNIERIAEAMNHPQTSLNTTENKKKVKDAIAWMHAHVYGVNSEENMKRLTSNQKEAGSNKKTTLNWWDFEIGSPEALTDTLILMDKDFTFKEKKKYIAPINKYVPKSNEVLASVGKPEKAKGNNLVDISKVKLTESLIEEDKNMMKSSVDSFNKVFDYVQDYATGKERNGFFRDGSYIDHQDVPYTGAYGVVLLEGISQMLPIVYATPFDVNNEQLQVLDYWIDEAFMPLIHKGEFMDFVRGRAISRENETSHSTATTVMKSLLRMSDVMHDQTLKNKYKQYVKTSVLSDDSYHPNDHLKSYADIHNMKKLIEDSSITTKNKPQQLKIYDEMKRVVYHNSNLNYTFGLSLTSNKVARYESINNENLKGWHTGAGMYYLYNNDVKHYRDDFWATSNMHYLAGTTTLNDEPTGNRKSEKTFVGGTRYNDKFASIGMDFENQQHTLTANKSWFILDDKIVFMGSGIVNKDKAHDANTTIENRKANGYTLFHNNHPLDNAKNKATTSIFLEAKDTQNNIGYRFLDAPKLTISKNERSGMWKDINESQSKDEHKNTYYEVVQPHSNTNNTYAYVLYPGIAQSEFKNKKDDISIIKQDEQFHVVKDNVNHVWGIVNYANEPQTFEIDGNKVEIKGKGMFMIKKNNDGILEGTYNNPEVFHSATDLKSKISIKGYNILIKDVPNQDTHFELKK
ncbi:polysaccharide lyase 8 family protein [Staphylococcus saccharolyticus]|uniref:polysaccharide lyase 8 family protein n=1 Tax=Staphylococcus saccharolyticus TaxID=33028 RepID=UPI0032DEA49F